jgi:glycosyltransferase involved in cell wall biosynthesis
MKTGYSNVSVVLPVFNDKQRLEKCLHALEHQTFPKDRYEVIVVDNASTVDLKSLVTRFQQAHYCYEGEPGSYAARNKGLSVATGDIIAFTDSDCIPASNWIERGASTLQQMPDCGLVGGAITIFVKDPARPTGVEIYESLKGFPQKDYIEKSQFGATANVFTSRKIIDAVGYFNSELKSGGDAEWGKRVAKAGYQLHYADDVEVQHPARSSYSEYYKKTVRVMSGLPAYRNPGPVSLFAIIRRLIGGIKPPVSRIRRTLAEAAVESVEQKIKLVTFGLFLHYVWLFEGARLKYKNKE